MNIHLTGQDGNNWALDEDAQLIHKALENKVTFTSIHKADIIHSVTSTKLATIPQNWLVGKKVICHISTSVPAFFQIPKNRFTLNKTSLFITRSQEAHLAFNRLNIHNTLIPYAIDENTFKPLPSEQHELIDIYNQYNIPKNKYLIGNFHRDTLGTNLNLPKPQKGADLFAEVMINLHRRTKNIHVLLAGPRRHYLKHRFDTDDVPYTFIGEQTSEDDYPLNVLPRTKINLLYNILDLCLVTSRSEGGPHAILEAGATRCKVLSTRVGHAPDILNPNCIIDTPSDFVGKIIDDIDSNWLSEILDEHQEKILKDHTSDTLKRKISSIYENTISIHPIALPPLRPNQVHHPASPSLLSRVIRKFFPKQRQPTGTLKISIWHTFRPPPYGGGNQFSLALENEFSNRPNIYIYRNKFSSQIHTYMLNAVQFDFDKFKRYERNHPNPAIVHRIDGPIHLIRGKDRELDEKTYNINKSYASSSIIQSHWNLEKIASFPYWPVLPTVIHNATNPKIFHSKGRIEFSPNRKVRLIATSWSGNPRKGGAIYKWLEDNLDWDRFEFTFVGNTSETLTHANHLPPMGSENLANALRNHDIYITASQNDPCSNALIEALSCGLPSLYYNDGGHPELVQFGGLPFDNTDDIFPQLETLISNYQMYQNLIVVNNIKDVADKYLEIAYDSKMGL